MRVSGKMICSTATESKPGPTSLSMKATMLLAASTELEATSGTMDLCTQVTGGKTRFLASESTRGSMEDATKENGSTITWKEWASTFGMMAECTRGSTKMTRNMDSVSIRGLTSAAMRATGTRASSTVLVHTSCPRTIKSNLDFGRMVNALNGSTKRKFRPSMSFR